MAGSQKARRIRPVVNAVQLLRLQILGDSLKSARTVAGKSPRRPPEAPTSPVRVTGVTRVRVEEAPDVLVLPDQGHLGRLGLAPEAAEAVLDDGVPAVQPVAVRDDAVDLELELGAEVLGQGARVDELAVAADEQDARGGPGVRLLGRLDAVPHDAGAEAVDGEAAVRAEGEELGRGVALEEDDLGRAAVVLAVGLGRVDVGGVDAARGAHGVDGRDEPVGGQVGGQVDQEEGAVELVGHVGAAVALEVGVAVVRRAEAEGELGEGVVELVVG